jgi:hypothetical protein
MFLQATRNQSKAKLQALLPESLAAHRLQPRSSGCPGYLRAAKK